MSFKEKKIFTLLLLLIFFIPENAYAMHIMEGFLPAVWCIVWAAAVIPFLFIGLSQIRKKTQGNPKIKILLGVAGAFVFVLSALKLPSVTGSCSHPTGVGLGAVLFGPSVMSVLGCIVLLFQALLLAHGGVTTLGANVFAMAVAGPLVAFAVFKLSAAVRSPKWLSVFLAAFLGNLATYLVTALQLALAFPAETGSLSAGFALSLGKFSSVFAFTQLPLAVSEGLLTVIVFNVIYKYNRNELHELGLLNQSVSAVSVGMVNEEN